ncbi:MAG: UDP-N-acetylglucosamine 2-epimerase (non-hydrolyzing) [Desulfobacterales bacterium]|nr:UDP-N-acetylglucosamine 2-epimerase (non-hydrolyzing) [Desulfobacterales bacterium]
MDIHLIAAARPNFMKVAPLFHELNNRSGLNPKIIHTGQHYDLNMSDVFFQDFSLPEPHIHLGVGSGTHAQQTGNVMIAYEKVLMAEEPSLVIVVGDVNSTLAATLAAVKLGIPVAHLEAGLRSFDRSMPEEINRLVTDKLADFLWTPSPDGNENLENEGTEASKISFVGNIMIDAFELVKEKICKLDMPSQFNLSGRPYGLVTLHRPSNVDDPETLSLLCRTLTEISADLPLIFPVHPRTKAQLEKYGLWTNPADAPGIRLTGPLGYKQFMNLVMNARVLVTDSGGVQEETTYLGIPCLTLRDNTERPVTITLGTNRLCRIGDLKDAVADILNGKYKKGGIPELWDGRTAVRIGDLLENRIKHKG